MTLLRDVIDIPEQVHAGDFVLNLNYGVDHTEATVRDYVVTDSLARAFDRALGLVENALRSGRSQAAFLHGSFGSGKSHFMAVLHALLGGSPAARGIPELAETIARHDAVLQGRSFLRLAYHLIGAQSLEHALFGGYIRQVRSLHPDAPLAALHHTDGLLDDAANLRRKLGDERFFADLNGGASGAGDVWAAFVGRWDAGSYDRAAAALPDDPERGRLADALVRTFFRSFTESGTYVDIDTGLRVMAEHARGLGYDAVVLFLDELVLWLASRLPNRDFVSNEGAKVAKLVESADARRPIPLVSFIARQRDLKDFLGEAVPGAQQEAISDTFRWGEERFDPITLGDENLPYIAQRRLLRPRDDQARQVLDQAFSRLDHRPEIWNTLLDGFNTDERHRGADEEAFRLTYPFSPALVSTLRAVSSLMQRERTALKVMQQILVDQRDELTIDDLVPAGDAFDQVVGGEQALDPAMERHFAAARHLYRRRIRPMLLRTHGLTEEEAQHQGYRSRFRADDRLAKTLLLSALVPGVPALRDLDASRLAALNHGTITSPLPYQEASVVLTKLREWQPQIPEIQIVGDQRNPTLSIRLADVDHQSVLDRVRHVDNTGSRRRLLKELVWESLGITYDPEIFGTQQHVLTWRASRRVLEVAFGNVRDASDVPSAVLVHDSDNWRLVVDYPFDEEGNGPSDDFARIEEVGGPGAVSRTVVWIPRFFTLPRQDDLGNLARLEHLLGGAGERFDEAADHLSATDRAQARSILQTMRVSLRDRLLGVIQQAYGAARAVPGDVEATPGEDRVLACLDPSLDLQEPVGATLRAALENLTDQLLSHSFPEHPLFSPAAPPLRAQELRSVLDHVATAHQEPNGRVPVGDQQLRHLLHRICRPLGLGEMYESVYVLDPGAGFPWRNRFAQQMGQEGVSGPVKLEWLRRWVDPRGSRGLDPLVADLVIAAWAIVSDRAWYLHGTGVPQPELGKFDRELELREQDLPSAEVWSAAGRRVAALFGVTAGVHVTAASLAAFSATVRERATGLVQPARELVRALEENADVLELDRSQAAGRLATARAAARLVEQVSRARDSLGVMSLLAQVELPGEDQVVARSLQRAGTVAAALAHTQWHLLQAIGRLGDERRERASAILTDLAEASRVDEFQRDLALALGSAQRAAAEVLAAAPRPPDRPIAPPVTPILDHSTVVDAARIENAIEPLRRFAERHPDERIRVSWDVEPRP